MRTDDSDPGADPVRTDWRSLPHSCDEGTLYRAFLERGDRPHATDKWHHYFDVYERYFAPFRGKDVRMLEIGVQRGGSLDIWKSYFGPGSQIVGLDIDPQCARLASDNVRIYIGDQADRELLRRIKDECGPFDIVLDDGGHTMNQMITTFEELYASVRCPGVYMVEDTHTCFWGGQFADRPNGETFIGRAAGLISRLHEWTGRPANFRRLGVPPTEREGETAVSSFCRTTHSVAFYDSIVVFERRQRPEPWREVR